MLFRSTASLKPFWPVTVTVNVTVPLIETGGGVEMEMVKSGVKLTVRATGAVTVRDCGAMALVRAGRDIRGCYFEGHRAGSVLVHGAQERPMSLDDFGPLSKLNGFS